MSMPALEPFTVLVYALFCFVVVFPPTELLSAGLTLEKVFGFLLGDEQLSFTSYHIRRTCLNIVAHSLLPLGFFLVLELGSSELDIWELLSWEVEEGAEIFRYALLLSLALPLATMSMVFYWSIGGWREHPLARTLRVFGPDWKAAAASIDVEYRRVDKFSVALGGICRVLVTDSWILFVSTYRLQLTQQSHARLTLVSQDSHVLSHHSDSQAQFLSIRVDSPDRPQLSSFLLRLNALNYADLRAKVESPINEARDVMVQGSLDDQFVEAFRETAERNPRSEWTDEEKSLLDACLGCGTVRADVRLNKVCVDRADAAVDANGEEVPNCRACFCRPMWCVACMGRWFASRQDPHQPQRWLEGKSPCPTCRAVFCLMDVSIVV